MIDDRFVGRNDSGRAYSAAGGSAKETQFAARVRIRSPHSAHAHSAHEENLRPLRIFAEYAREEKFCGPLRCVTDIRPPLRPVSTYSASVTNICFVRDLYEVYAEYQI